MKLIKYLIPVWIGVFIYAGMSLFFGAKGLSAYSQLEAERKREQANINILAEVNRDLINSRNNLKTNANDYLVYARELGFASKGENFIRIIGLKNSAQSISAPGHVIMPVSPQHIPDKPLRIISFFLSFTMIVSMLTFDFLKIMKGRDPVQDSL